MAVTALPSRVILPAHLEIRDLRLIVAVAAEGSLTRAGSRLHVTQPALSRQLAGLERRVGLPLFVRTGSRMVPTPAGELLLRHARGVLDRIAAAESALHDLNEAPRHSIRVGTECYTGYHWLPAVLSRYATRHPNVEVEIAFEAARKPLRLLRAGRIHVAILTDSEPHESFPVWKLFSDEFVAVVSPSHEWATRGHIEPSDLEGERALILAPPEHSTVIRRFIKPAGVRLRQVVDVQLIGALAALAEEHFGVGLVPNWIIAPEIRSGRLVPIRLGRSGLRRTWTAALAKNVARERWLQDFVHSMAAGGPLATPTGQPASLP
ncbi:MAG TPA: LysR family transcriptional regulator [Gemmatimonadaceae bacterium]